MENLPNEINREILKFTYRCRKEERLIFNKESHCYFRFAQFGRYIAELARNLLKNDVKNGKKRKISKIHQIDI